jgi:hypothetical protein
MEKVMQKCMALYWNFMRGCFLYCPKGKRDPIQATERRYKKYRKQRTVAFPNRPAEKQDSILCV